MSITGFCHGALHAWAAWMPKTMRCAQCYAFFHPSFGAQLSRRYCEKDAHDARTPVTHNGLLCPGDEGEPVGHFVWAPENAPGADNFVFSLCTSI